MLIWKAVGLGALVAIMSVALLGVLGYLDIAGAVGGVLVGVVGATSYYFRSRRRNRSHETDQARDSTTGG